MTRNRLGVMLFALALAIQALAPAANIASAALGDRGFSLQICLQSGDVAGSNLPGQNDRQRDSCPVCQVSCSGVAPLGAWLPPVDRAPVQWIASSWTVVDRVLPAPNPDYSRRARAPPALS